MCMLRVVGTAAFNVDDFISASKMKPSVVWRKGEPRWPRSNPNGPKCSTTGANFVVSNASWRNLSKQVTAAISFLKKNRSAIRRLKNAKGLGQIYLDFPLEVKREVWDGSTTQGVHFPKALISIADDLGVEMCITVYTGQNSKK